MTSGKTTAVERSEVAIVRRLRKAGWGERKLPSGIGKEWGKRALDEYGGQYDRISVQITRAGCGFHAHIALNVRGRARYGQVGITLALTLVSPTATELWRELKTLTKALDLLGYAAEKLMPWDSRGKPEIW